jgi:hypothetical protein
MTGEVIDLTQRARELQTALFETTDASLDTATRIKLFLQLLEERHPSLYRHHVGGEPSSGFFRIVYPPSPFSASVDKSKVCNCNSISTYMNGPIATAFLLRKPGYAPPYTRVDWTKPGAFVKTR